MVSPPAFEEPFDEEVCACGESGHLRQLDFDGAGFNPEQRPLAARGSKTPQLLKACAHDARRHHGCFASDSALLRQPRGAHG